MRAENLQAGGDINLTQQKIVLPPESPDPAQQLDQYLRTVASFCAKLPLAPLDPTGRESARITLEQVYVGLDAVPSQAITFA
jgi:hypothetical protein